MSKRTKAVSEEKDVSEVRHEEEEEAQDPPETRRTRSGRRVRAPAALLESSVRTPTRRTRRSVIQELKEAEDMEPQSETAQAKPAEPEPAEPAEPVEAAEATEAEADPTAAGAHVNGDAQMPRPAPTETVPAAAETVTQPQKKPRLGSSVKPGPAVPLGKPKSGRVWKDRNKQRFSALVRDKPLCSSWEKKMAAKREKELVKKFSLQLKEEKDRQKEEKRKRREENLKRRSENERKAEIVQVIRNTTKIKRMKKKQLRKIEKRDTLALLQKNNNQAAKSKPQRNKKAAAPTPDLT